MKIEDRDVILLKAINQLEHFSQVAVGNAGLPRKADAMINQSVFLHKLANDLREVVKGIQERDELFIEMATQIRESEQ